VITEALSFYAPTVFSEDVKYVLVLATPVEIVLLAVWFEDNTPQGEIHLEPSTLRPAPNYECSCGMLCVVDGFPSILERNSAHCAVCGQREHGQDRWHKARTHLHGRQ
jgi:hypothetical protein